METKKLKGIVENYYGVGYPPRPKLLRDLGKAAAKVVDGEVRRIWSEGNKPIMVGRGDSGSMIMAAIMVFMEEDIDCVHLKKEGETSHGSGSMWNGPFVEAIVVDDMIETGATMKAIFDTLKEYQVKCRTVILGHGRGQSLEQFDVDTVWTGLP